MNLEKYAKNDPIFWKSDKTIRYVIIECRVLFTPSGESQSSSLGSATIAGIVIGVVVLFIALAGIAALAYVKNRYRKNN